MAKKFLGKIISVEYGMDREYPFIFGLQLTFKLGSGSEVDSSARYTVNISKNCRWEESERNDAIAKNIDTVAGILKDAKVSYISELVNKPVEVEIEQSTFKSFRILTEVL